MSDGNSTGKRGPDKDPMMFTAFVEYKLKHNVGRKEIIDQLIAKGLTHGQASTLTDSVATRLAMEAKVSSIGGLIVARQLGGAALGMLLALAIWGQFLTGVARPGGFVAVAVLTAAGSVLGAWGRKSKLFAPAALLIALIGMGLGTYISCDLYNQGVIETLRSFNPTDASMQTCMKTNLIGHYDAAWAVGSLIVNWMIASKPWILARLY
jgi:hypothetical protein